MTYIHHDVVVATLLNVGESEAQAIEELEALRNEMGEYERRYFVGPIAGWNDWVTFAMLPDGSSGSAATAWWRLQFIEIIKRLREQQIRSLGENEASTDLIALRFGGDPSRTEIYEDTDPEIQFSRGVAIYIES